MQMQKDVLQSDSCPQRELSSNPTRLAHGAQDAGFAGINDALLAARVFLCS